MEVYMCVYICIHSVYICVYINIHSMYVHINIYTQTGCLFIIIIKSNKLQKPLWMSHPNKPC